ncbi:MAG: hypothetical protein WB615_10530 [Candidatus Tumulicola sp.]
MAIATAAAVTAVAAAMAAPFQTPGSNVSVTTCQAQLGKPPLKIGYENLAPTVATEVDFAIVASVDTIETVRDIGRFASGTPISHVFDLPADTSPLGLSSARCVVTKVVYADGTTWLNPNPSP